MRAVLRLLSAALTRCKRELAAQPGLLYRGEARKTLIVGRRAPHNPGTAGALLSAQLVEQRSCVVEVGGVKAVGEPAVDFGEHRTRFGTFTLAVKQSRETQGRAQFWMLRPHLLG